MPQRDASGKFQSANVNDKNVLAGTTDLMTSWYLAVDRLQNAAAQLAKLRIEHDSIVTEAARLESERESILSKGNTDEAATVSVARLSAKTEIFARKIARAQAEVDRLEAGLAENLERCKIRFQSLWRGFRFFVIEREKAHLREFLIPNSQLADHVIELTASHFKTVAELSSLEIADAMSVGGLVERCQALLERVSTSGWSDVPPYESEPVESASADYGLPWDPGDGSTAELLNDLARSENLTLPAAMEKLHSLRPDLFRTPAEVLALNEPPRRMENMIGDTYDDSQVFTALNSP